MLKDKRGFTFIELVISMAVFVIVAGAVTIFMITGTNSFNRTRDELDVQLQTQTVFNQIADMVRSADYVEYKTLNESGKTINALLIYQVEEKAVAPSASPGAAVTPTPSPIAGVDPSKVIQKTVTNKKVVYWISSDKEMYFEQPADPNKKFNNSSDFTDDCLFAEYISNFSADVVNKAVKLDISMKKGKSNYSKYEIKETVSMRNRTVTPTDTP